MNVIPQAKQPTELRRDEYVQTVTVKGQVTIPVELRKMLGVQANSQVLVSLEAGKVVIKPVSMTLEEAFGSVQPISVPENFKELRKIAREEHIERGTQQNENQVKYAVCRCKRISPLSCQR